MTLTERYVVEFSHRPDELMVAVLHYTLLSFLSSKLVKDLLQRLPGRCRHLDAQGFG